MKAIIGKTKFSPRLIGCLKGEHKTSQPKSDQAFSGSIEMKGCKVEISAILCR